MVLLTVFFAGSAICSSAQSQTITGKVTSSEDNLGLPGANVLIKGTARGTVTDADGNYSIEVSSGDAILVFSSIGYATAEVPVSGRTVINVALIQDVTQLSEIVVVGYGTVKKSDVTGALSRVSADVIQERPAQNLFQALQGKASGVHITSNFKPGELPVVRVRGSRSLEASNEPLYVIDGIPLVSGNISDISPNDIASIEVLKDASATAIYGSRGANGVVLITTKRGSSGQMNVTYNGSVSLDSYKSLTDWMNGGQYIDRWRLSLMNGGLYSTAQFTDFNTPVVLGYPDPAEDIARMGLAQDPVAMESVLMGYEWEDEIGGTVRMRPTTAEEKAMGWPDQVPVYNSANIRSYDWIKDATRQGVTNNHQIAISTGSETSNLYLSLNYFDQVGVQRDQDYQRFTATINGELKPTEWLTAGGSVIASHSVQNYGFLGPNTSNTGSKDLYSRATEQFPYALPKDETGNWIKNPGGNLSLWNPLIDIDQAKNERRASSMMASLFAEIKLTPWLKYRTNVGSQIRNYRVGSWTGPNATSHLTNRPNTAGYSNEERFSWVMENLLFIDKTFADVHKVGITLLQSAQKYRQESINARVSSTVIDIAQWYDLASNLNGSPDGYGTAFTENTLMSFMGRVNYSFMDRYLLTASGRYDGASVLAPGHKWHFFPSFAVAWKMHEETFLSGVPWLVELKPRVGYGVTGNSSVRPYTTSGPLSRNPYVFGSTPAISYLPQLVRNSLLAWERTAQLNIGVDFSILRNRISGSLEWYEANTSDLILVKDMPAVSGYVQKYENVGATRNRGFEITLSTVNIEKGDFTWSMDINWATNREEIVELLNGKQDMLAQRWFIGHPLQVYYQYANDGIWQNTAEDLEEMAKFNANGHRFHPGTIKVVDQNGDYRITADDMVIRGSNRPDWTGGITNTFRYKNWTLSSFIYARWGQTYFGGYPNSYGGVWPNGRVENDVWSWDNPGGRWPMPNFGNVENITAAMQYNDGSFAVVRNISLNYDVPAAWLQRISMKNLSLNVQVLNPFIFGGDVVKMGLNPDDDTNWDRASSNTNPLGGTNNNTILPQSIVFGVRAGF
jgi:TonB-linked SusC/RagA family outer membrane protein